MILNLPTIIVHGGAGKWKDERIPVGLEEVEKAAEIGFKILEKGGSALDAAEGCTVYMESCGNLNAGIGARKTIDGIRELDAMIIDGPNLESGAVMAVKGVRHPTPLARYVMEETKYNQIAGEGARLLYQEMISKGYREESEPGYPEPKIKVEGEDTVGCVVVDKEGQIAATSSTGGISDKLPGRVGDSPVFGAGAYANDIAGATATGYGEHIVRVQLTRMVVLYIEQGMEVQAACDKAMNLFEEKTGSEAGVIAVDRDGNHGWALNTKAMPSVVISGSIDNMKSETFHDQEPNAKE